jgi:SAM-dependent methyltransferase
LSEEQHRGAYLSFWNAVGTNFPSLKGAPSTAYYAACEQWLLGRFFPDLRGRTLLKTDLWDEAKNSEILLWAAEQGARPFGIDVAADVVADARKVLAKHRPCLAGADVRQLPFGDASFDLVYSMGTIEHFADYDRAVGEMFRVLRPGGTAIIGVPNKLDPFLRPLMVHLMNALNVYGYGLEKSFVPAELRALLRRAGFEVQDLSGILFIPGWLRMLDLWCHTRAPVLTRVTGALISPFAWTFSHVSAVRRHGYLIACVATRPALGRPAA